MSETTSKELRDLVIVGGGLSGLALAQHAQQQGLNYVVLEARQRFGGRILSKPGSSENGFTSASFQVELGPCWLWPEGHRRIASILDRYGLKYHGHFQDGYQTYLQEKDETPVSFLDSSGYGGACRVDTGFGSLVDNIVKSLDSGRLFIFHPVKQIFDRDDHVEVHSNTAVWYAKRVALCLPPRLIAEKVTFTPALDGALMQAMQDTPTWMAGHAKFVAEYEKPFWREKGKSGNGMAGYSGAVLAEVFDLCSSSGTRAALGGFGGWTPDYRKNHSNELKDEALEQLVLMFGPQAARPVTCHIQDWSTEDYTATTLDQQPLRGHPRYGHPLFQRDYWKGKLYFGGTEAAPKSGGFLEGALVAAERIAAALKGVNW
eukprot:Nitzschia sp. Nitz4//scaffold192_size41448//580//1701//NITZ4_007479-RA/size41448-processed-gene-0.23-mRNA-1//-1//CDS//3329540218//6965//frame0